MQIRSTPRHIVIDALPSGTASLDVRFDDARVWSIDVRDAGGRGGRQFAWPTALRPHLTGHTSVSVADSGNGTVLATTEAVFDEQDHRTRVVDPSGHRLAINKWGRLGVALEAMDASVQRRIVEGSVQIVDDLREMGLRPFVVGGTLLGAVRDGRLLPHDDDADIAYLSEHRAPVDVALEAFRVGRALEAHGHEIKRHSATHMQLLFRDEAGFVSHYIDVFAAFFSADGYINQPFHVRGEMRRDQIVPFGTVQIDGTPFPAPFDTNRWLTLNYDKNWRTPIPGYVLETPPDTSRRFDGWFGSFNFHRDFWDEFHHHPTDEQTARTEKLEARWEHGRSWLVARSAQDPAPTIINLGSGGGALARKLAADRPGRRVIGLDYSGEAVQRARRKDPDRLAEYARANLYRARALTLPQQLGVDGPFDIVANHVFDEIGHHGRAWAWRLIRMALRSGGAAHLTFHARPKSNVRFENPTGWHLEPSALAEEAAAFGLEVELELLSDSEGAPPIPMPLRLARAEAKKRHSRRPTGATVRLTRAGATVATDDRGDA